MPIYFPIITEPVFRCSLSDLIDFRWTKRGSASPSFSGGIVADFEVPGDERQILRVEFDRVEILRILDEMNFGDAH